MDCGGKRSATPLFARTKDFLKSEHVRPPESGVAAPALPPQSMTHSEKLAFISED